MKYFSEKTKKFYEDEKACVDAEKTFDEEQAKIEAERKALAEARKERAKELEDLYAQRNAIDKEIVEKRNAFIRDYGSFHMTIRNQEMPSPFEDLVRYFFM